MSAPHADRDHSEQPRRYAKGGMIPTPIAGDTVTASAASVADAVVAAGPDADEVTLAEHGRSVREVAREVYGSEIERLRAELKRLGLEVAKVARERSAAEAERDRLAEVVARVEALLEVWEADGPQPAALPVENLRAALSGPTPAHTPATDAPQGPGATDQAPGRHLLRGRGDGSMTQHDEAIIAKAAEAIAPLFGDGVVLDARLQQERIARAVLDALDVPGLIRAAKAEALRVEAARWESGPFVWNRSVGAAIRLRAAEIDPEEGDHE